MNSKARRNGNGKKNIKRHLKNSRKRLQVNRSFLYQEERDNSEWRQMHQDMQQEKYYPKKKMENGN